MTFRCISTAISQSQTTAVAGITLSLPIMSDDNRVSLLMALANTLMSRLKQTANHSEIFDPSHNALWLYVLFAILTIICVLTYWFNRDFCNYNCETECRKKLTRFYNALFVCFKKKLVYLNKVKFFYANFLNNFFLLIKEIDEICVFQRRDLSKDYCI